MSHDYRQFVEQMAESYGSLFQQSAASFGKVSPPKILLHSSDLPPLVKPENLPDQPAVMIVSPHPDDECLMAGYALRMMEEWGARVTVVPFGFGSNVSRQEARSVELREAVKILGFQLWKSSDVEEAFEALQPVIVFSPHSKDFHPTHTAAFSAVKNSEWRKKHQPLWIQTEYWQANEKPNLMIPLGLEHVVKIGEALMKHEGEVLRNPYHLRLPAWFMDQARRAQEILPGFGKEAPSEHVIFGQLVQVVDLA